MSRPLASARPGAASVPARRSVWPGARTRGRRENPGDRRKPPGMRTAAARHAVMRHAPAGAEPAPPGGRPHCGLWVLPTSEDITPFWKFESFYVGFALMCFSIGDDGAASSRHEIVFSSVLSSTIETWSALLWTITAQIAALYRRRLRVNKCAACRRVRHRNNRFAALQRVQARVRELFRLTSLTHLIELPEILSDHS
jgi:hypothetical protein